MVLFALQVLGIVQVITTPLGVLLMLVAFLYMIFFFSVAERQSNILTAYIIGLSLFIVGLAFSAILTGGYNSPYMLMWTVTIFMTTMTGLVMPSLMMLLSSVTLIFVQAGILEVEGESAAVLVWVRHLLALLIGYLIFRRYYVRDDSAVEQLRKQLRSEQLKSDVILSSLNDGVIIIDANFKVRFANHVAIEMLGLSEKSIHNKLLDQIIQSNDKFPKMYLSPEVLQIAIAQMFESRLPLRYEQVYIKTSKDTDLFVSLSIIPVKNNSDSFSSAIVLLHDIGELHRIQAIKDEFIAISSHELHTPMTVIKGYAELLLSTGDINESQAHYLERIKDTTDDLLHLSGNLLDMSRLSTGSAQLNPQETRLKDLVETITGHYRARCKENKIELMVTVPDEANAYVDVEKFQKVLDNLIDNAYKHSQEKDKIEVIVEDSSEVAFSITVLDDGKGIETDLRTRLFEQFSEENYLNHSKGTGLGLSLSKQFVELWGGTIEFLPNEDKGSLFRFTVPKYKKEIE